MNTKTALVLLSGGLDSSFNLAAAVADSEIGEVYACFIDYGQRAALSEQRSVQALCEHYSIELIEVELPWLASLSTSALTNKELDVPNIEFDDLDRMEITRKTMQAVWVPNRNGVLVNVAAAIAEARSIDRIFVGFNLEEATTFPDNSMDYLRALNSSLSLSTNGKVGVDSYSIEMDKQGIVRRGSELNLPFQLIWSCYSDKPEPCGKCESCQRLARAMEALA